MRISDEELAQLSSLSDFDEYYDELTASEMVQELDRIITDGPILRSTYQHCSMHRRFVDYATKDEELSDHNRRVLISVAVRMRGTIEDILFPALDSSAVSRIQAALLANDDYIRRFAYYPTAAEAILSRDLAPPDHYEMGFIGQLLSKERSDPGQ